MSNSFNITYTYICTRAYIYVYMFIKSQFRLWCADDVLMFLCYPHKQQQPWRRHTLKKIPGTVRIFKTNSIIKRVLCDACGSDCGATIIKSVGALSVVSSMRFCSVFRFGLICLCLCQKSSFCWCSWARLFNNIASA